MYYLTDFSVTTYSDIQFIICTNTSYTVTEGNVTGLIDRETVPIVLDGQKGKQGDNAFVLDIDNEMAAIPVNEQGKTTGALALDFGLNAFYGTTSVLNDCTVTVDGSAPNGFTVDLTDKFNPSISIAANIQPAEVTDIVLKAVHATYGTRYATFTVCAVKSGGRGEDAEIYQLKPSHTALQFARNSSGDLTGSYTLTCQIQKTVGSTTTNHDSLSGYYIYYGWDGAASPSTSLPTTGRSVGTSEAASHTSVVLELWRGQRSASGSVRLDRETIPILKDGTKGGPGDNGNGIANIYFYRMFTQSFEAPAENDSGWIASTSGSYPTEAGLTKENRYLWQKKLTSYTRSDNPTIEISLLAQFDSGVQENLLEDTAFLSEGQMEAWDVKNGGINTNSVGAHNGFGYTPVWADQYTEMLRQNVYKYGELQKLKPNTWYTLSFYGAMQAYQDLLNSSVYNGSDGGSYWQIGASRRGFWLTPGASAIVQVTGRVYSTQVKLTVFGFDDDWTSANTKSVIFTSTSSTTKAFLLTNNSSVAKHFNVEGYVYLNDGNDTQNTYSDINHRGYITLIRVDRGCKMHSYLYRSDNGEAVQHSSSAPWYVDGKKFTAAGNLDDGDTNHVVTIDGTQRNMHDGTRVQFGADGGVLWQLHPGTVRHSVTFKTPSSLTSGVYYRVLFRLSEKSHYGWISMPKLEENTIASEWIEHTNDRMADDIQHVYVGEWRASTVGDNSTNYLYALGVRHVVRAKTNVNGNMTYWRMKQRTISTGYCSTVPPYNDTTHWERADYLKFIAADLLLAEEVITDKLTVTKMRTTGSNTYVDIHDGMIEFFGSLGFPNISLGVDSNGCAVLKFYDKDGNFKYDLGPDTIMSQMDSVANSWGTAGGGGGMGAYDLSQSWSYGAERSLPNVTTQNYYRFIEGYTMLNNIKKYNISGTSTPSQYNNKCYDSKSTAGTGNSAYPNGNKLPAGYYVGKEFMMATAQEIASTEGIYSRKCYYVASLGAVPTLLGDIYYHKDSNYVNNTWLTDPNGNRLNCSSSMKMLDYIYGNTPSLL